MPVKLVSAGGGGVILQPASSIGSDVILETPVTPQRLLGNKTAGTVLQVQQSWTNVVTTINTGTDTDISGLAVSITPGSASNKILVLAQVGRSGGNGNGFINLYRNSTRLMNGSGATYTGTLDVSSAYSQQVTTSPIVYLDDPGTTSAITYKLMGNSISAGSPMRINERTYDAGVVRSVSSIIVMEIAG